MLNYEIPVIFEIIPDAVTLVSDGKSVGNLMTANSRLDDMIKAGLRTQLDVESWVTGQLVINLDMHPDTPAVFRGDQPPYPEIPSIPSDIQQVLRRIQAFVTNIQQKVPMERIIEDLMSAVNGFDQLVNSPDLKQMLAGLNRLVNARETQDLPTNLTGAIADLRAASQEGRALLGKTNQSLDTVLQRAVPALEQMESTLREGEKVLKLARGQLQNNPETAAQLAKALREVERSARAIRILVDYLERQPESVWRGKPIRE
jgi:paraquat-inducible protein B